MDKHQRRKKFVQSLTEEQRSLYCLMREGVHQTRGDYHKSLSKDQKEKIKKRHKHKHKHMDGDKSSIEPPPPPVDPADIKAGDKKDTTKLL